MDFISYTVLFQQPTKKTEGANSNLYVFQTSEEREAFVPDLKSIAVTIQGASNKLTLSVYTADGWEEHDIENLVTRLDNIDAELLELAQNAGGGSSIFVVSTPAALADVAQAEKIINRFFLTTDYLANGTNKRALYIYRNNIFSLLCAETSIQDITDLKNNKLNKIENNLTRFGGVQDGNVVNTINAIISALSNAAPLVPTYNPASQYIANSLVKYNGILYVSNKVTTGAFKTADWDEFLTNFNKVIGGIQLCASFDERNAIPQGIRKELQVAVVKSNGKAELYLLLGGTSNAAWVNIETLLNSNLIPYSNSGMGGDINTVKKALDLVYNIAITATGGFTKRKFKEQSVPFSLTLPRLCKVTSIDFIPLLDTTPTVFVGSAAGEEDLLARKVLYGPDANAIVLSVLEESPLFIGIEGGTASVIITYEVNNFLVE